MTIVNNICIINVTNYGGITMTKNEDGSLTFTLDDMNQPWHIVFEDMNQNNSKENQQ